MCVENKKIYSFVCLYRFFFVPLQPNLRKRINLTACDLSKRMLKTCTTGINSRLVDFFDPNKTK